MKARIVRAEPGVLPDGQYPATWSGYSVTVETGGLRYSLETDCVLKGILHPCTVVVKDGTMTVDAG